MTLYPETDGVPYRTRPDGTRVDLKGYPLCIANNGANGEPEVPLWECPCSFCTKMDWEALDDDRPLLREFRAEGFPSVWPIRSTKEGT